MHGIMFVMLTAVYIYVMNIRISIYISVQSNKYKYIHIHIIHAVKGVYGRQTRFWFYTYPVSPSPCKKII